MTDQIEEGMIAKDEELLEEKKTEEAVEVAEELAEYKPGDAIVWFVKGKTLYIAEDYEEALACLVKAAELKREQPEIWQMMGYCLIALRRYREALESLEYVKAMQEDNVGTICALALAYLVLGNAEKAGENLKAALAIDRQETARMLDEFYNRFFATSHELSSGEKAIMEREIKGIIHYVQSFCYRQLADLIMRRLIHIPILTLEGEHPSSLDARSRIRIEAFMEMLGA